MLDLLKQVNLLVSSVSTTCITQSSCALLLVKFNPVSNITLRGRDSIVIDLSVEGPDHEKANRCVSVYEVQGGYCDALT